ncbi:MAG: glycosyltransferase family 39 protein [Candidatus Hydrogenedentes bacterium]|nr:glycosyltransferase family 39 protein [Candidatus Hydrogenedentota bacterium]
MQRLANSGVGGLLIPLGVAVVASLLLLPNLDRSYLWQDEAQHALLSRTILSHGVPMGRDGLNSTSQEQGHDVGPDDTFRYHPWLPFYISAGAFATLGESTWTARFPFVVIGIATVVATYLLSLSLWRCRSTAVIAAGMLTFSVPYLLLVRQCRYYSPLAFFLLLGVWVYVELVRGKKWAPYALAIVATLLMHTLHLYAAVFLAAVVVHMAIWERALWKQVMIPAVAVAVIHIPWVIWISAVIEYGHAATVERMLGFGLWFAWRMVAHVFTPVIIVAAFALAVARKRKGIAIVTLERDQRAGAYLIALLVAIGLALLAARAPYTFFRYLAPFPPLAAVIGAPILISVFRTSRELGTLAALALGIWYLIPMGLAKLPAELLQPHNGPIRGIVEHLREHGESGDIVFITYGDMPVKFYLPELRVYGVGLTEETLRGAGNATWCVPRNTPMGHTKAELYKFMQTIITTDRFEMIPLDAPDLPYENREDVREHYFVTPEGTPPVRLFHRVK